MKELHFKYRMKLAFDHPVRQHRFTLKCVPQSGERQRITELVTEIYPNKFLAADQDSFGNHCIYGYCEEEHDHFSVLVSGIAKTGLSVCEAADDIYRLGMYKYQTPYTRPGVCLRTFHDRFSFSEKTDNLTKAVAFMTELYRTFSYVPGSTDIGTTAEEAMIRQKGVCQDYSHILLCLCRMEKIPSRYVVGMLIGEGFSHAWVEICSHGQWIALDPTNNLIVDDHHIKISCGRDYSDCMINQGLFTGQTRQTQSIFVSVTDRWGDAGA